MVQCGAIDHVPSYMAYYYYTMHVIPPLQAGRATVLSSNCVACVHNDLRNIAGNVNPITLAWVSISTRLHVLSFDTSQLNCHFDKHPAVVKLFSNLLDSGLLRTCSHRDAEMSKSLVTRKLQF